MQERTGKQKKERNNEYWLVVYIRAPRVVGSRNLKTYCKVKFVLGSFELESFILIEGDIVSH
jgi:hypothetical protein